MKILYALYVAYLMLFSVYASFAATATCVLVVLDLLGLIKWPALHIFAPALVSIVAYVPIAIVRWKAGSK